MTPSPDVQSTVFDAIVVGGGPAGATAATALARRGRTVLLLDRAGRIKPCGGAIPPRLIRDFAIPDALIVARIASARVISPQSRRVEMPIEDGFVGMVDRDVFDEWLRNRAAEAGAVRCEGNFEQISECGEGVVVHYRQKTDGAPMRAYARLLIGADGAKSAVARQTVKGADKIPYVFAYHEIVRTPRSGSAEFDGRRCDVYYRGSLSPDFYAWVFPHGDTLSIGTGSAVKGFSLRGAIRDLRLKIGLDGSETLRREGAPIPLRPMRRWDNGRNVVLAGDAAGIVAPASGEGIYYAMLGGQLAAEAIDACLATGNPQALKLARKKFIRAHGRVFLILGIMQYFWYKNDRRRERFVSICQDKDVQKLTWEAYMNKELVRRKPVAHMRIFFKDLAQLLGLASP